MHANARLLHLFERFGTALQVDAHQSLVHAGDVAQAVFLLRLVDNGSLTVTPTEEKP